MRPLSKRGPRRSAALAALALAALAAAGIGCGSNSTSVRASGMIEMDEIDVASMVGGRVARLTVDEGDTVRAGDTLAVLERDEVAAELRGQIAQAQRAAAQSQEVLRGPRAEEVRQARAALASAESQLDLAEKQLVRTQKLFDQQAASAEDLDRARSTRDDARGKRDAGREQLQLLEAGSRKEQIVAAREGAVAARASQLGAESRARELVLVAPVSGVVLLRNFEQGELVGVGQPVLTLGNPDRLWLRAYVAAPSIVRVRLGAPASIHLTGSRHEYRGRVTEIASRAEFTPRAALTEEERANIVFAVKIAIDPTGGLLKAGVPADASIEAARP